MCRISLLNGCSGFSVKLAVMRPVASLGVAVPFRRTEGDVKADRVDRRDLGHDRLLGGLHVAIELLIIRGGTQALFHLDLARHGGFQEARKRLLETSLIAFPRPGAVDFVVQRPPHGEQQQRGADEQRLAE